MTGRGGTGRGRSSKKRSAAGHPPGHDAAIAPIHASAMPTAPVPPAAHARRIAEACRMIERAVAAGEPVPALDRLAAMAGMSPFHFHRVFRGVAGVTPKAYAGAVRAQRLRSGLEATAPAPVTDAIHDAGYGSSSRFYEQSGQRLGMRPRDYRDGGRGQRIRFAIGECTLGAILVARSERGVCAISLGEDPDALARELQDRFPQAELIGGDAAFERLVAQVVGLVETPASPAPQLPLDIRGTAFQERVWRALQAIPPGRTASYADIAARIGQPKAVRAVARACATNVLAVAIPCHRVLRRDGDLAGYRWGVDIKRELLRRESVARGDEPPSAG